MALLEISVKPIIFRGPTGVSFEERMTMPTATERYRKHPVWETVEMKRVSLKAARFSDTYLEQQRRDVLEWLVEAQRSRFTHQPALYLGVLDEVSSPLNALGASKDEFYRFINLGHQQQLARALRDLPPPRPQGLTDAYISLLDAEIEARNALLKELELRVSETERALASQRGALEKIDDKADAIEESIDSARASIREVAASASAEIDRDWGERLHEWWEQRTHFDEEQNATILAHVASLAAVARSGEALAEHAAGSLSAADWSSRSKRERRAAQWMRFGAAVAFILAGAVGWFIVSEAIAKNFDLTVGDGILRASIATVIGAFGALILRESGRHFREADTAEDVALSLKALAPFYAGSQEEVRLAARVQVGDAVLVKNVLSRFAHRDAAKHAGEINTNDLPKLVEDATAALGRSTQSGRPQGL